MLRVLSLNYEYPPIGGGGGNAHRNILHRFAHLSGLEITLVTSTTEPQAYLEEYSPLVRIQYLPLKKKELHYWRRSEVLRYLWTHYQFLKTHLRDNEYDLCHVFFGFPSGLLAYLFRDQFPYIISVRGSDVPGYNQRFGLDYVLLGPLLNRIYHHAAAVVANSQGLKDLFETAYPDLCAEAITNGINTDFWVPLQKEYTENLRIATVARLIPRKGIDTLIQACGILHTKHIPFTCHIIGEGPEQGRLEKLAESLNIEDLVQFHGRMEQTRIAALLPLQDVFVLPSHAEGMSNAVLEAMACGLPLVLTGTGGTRELFHENGAVFPAGDAEALAVILQNLQAHPEKRAAMGRHSREHALHFSWQNVAEQYHDLYRRIAG